MMVDRLNHLHILPDQSDHYYSRRDYLGDTHHPLRILVTAAGLWRDYSILTAEAGEPGRLADYRTKRPRIYLGL
jgi:hypothetical protein